MIRNKNDDNNRRWRFWPLVFLSFVYSFASPLLMLATPIYYYSLGTSIKFISLLTMAITITYSISPLVLNKISDRLGRRRSVIISVIGATAAQLIFYITLEPIVFLVERLFEGFILGLFFPNLLASISDNPNIDHPKVLARFNLSWSLSSVFGLIFGAIFLNFIPNIKLLFLISPILLVFNVIIAIGFFHPVRDSENKVDIYLHKINEKEVSLKNYYIPVIVPLLFILASSIAAGNGGLLYPIKAEILGFPSSSTYLVMVAATIAQSFAMYMASSITLEKLKLVSLTALFVYSFLFIFLNINRMLIVFFVLFLFSGFFYGFLYGTASKLFLALNIIKDTSIYSSISESSVGVTYFISQLLLGFIADISIGFGYFTISLSLMATFFISVIFVKKIKKNK
ncbi:MAG: MFS transporter [Promethearchaeota archaeon]